MKTVPKLLLLCLATAAFLVPRAEAVVYMVNFGNGGNADYVVNGADRTNSPYHTASGSTDTTWNHVQTGDFSNLVSSTGIASTVGINLGVGGNTTTGNPRSTQVSLNTAPTGNASMTGSVVNTGIYAGTSVGKYGVYSSTSSTDIQALGMQITGLSAGTYELYITSRNTNNSAAQVFAAYTDATATAGDFNFSTAGGYQRTEWTVPASVGGVPSATSAWVNGQNYIKLTVDVAAGENLNLAIEGVSGMTRGFINSLQIVQVPEPSVSLLLLGGLDCTLFLRRR